MELGSARITGSLPGQAQPGKSNSICFSLGSQVDLHIPKVSIAGAYDLEALLKNMGFGDVFSDQANFSGITQEAQLKLSKVRVSRVYLYFPPK